MLAGGLVETARRNLAAAPGGGFAGIVTLVAAAGILLANYSVVRLTLKARSALRHAGRGPGIPGNHV